jgi:aquaporin Z
MRTALRTHWDVYLMEAAELGFFMLAACTFATLIFVPQSPVGRLLPDLNLKRIAMGIAMAATAIIIIHSPFGKRSGAHFNPAVTITYYWIRKISGWDAFFYVVAHFLGGLAGMLTANAMFGRYLADPAVRYIVTVPGAHGVLAAFVAEFLMAVLLMTIVLRSSNHPRWAPYTGYLVGLLVVLYIALFSAISGFSINPARTVSAGFVARIWTGVWIYFTAPLMGMVVAAEFYLRRFGLDRIYCAKLLHTSDVPCPFYCRFVEMSSVDATLPRG